MTLSEFVKELKEDVTAFDEMWQEENSNNPDAYPMEFDKDNEGYWWEQFIVFCEMRGK